MFDKKKSFFCFHFLSSQAFFVRFKVFQRKTCVPSCPYGTLGQVRKLVSLPFHPFSPFFIAFFFFKKKKGRKRQGQIRKQLLLFFYYVKQKKRNPTIISDKNAEKVVQTKEGRS